MNRIIIYLSLSFMLNMDASAQSSVTLHTQCNYSGTQYSLEPGSFRAYQMKISNDRLASIQIPNGFKVTIYEHDKFAGKSKTYTSSIACLEPEFRNMASSIVVEAPYNNNGGTGNEYVTFYNDCYNKGYTRSLRPGTYTGAQLGSSTFNISSFVITGDLRIRAFMNNENANGAAVNFTTSQTCLGSSYNDKIGSVVIEYAGGTTNPPYPGNGSSNGIYATLYTDCNYNGNALRLMPGTYHGDKLGLIKYNVSSIQLGTNLRAKVYLDNDYLSGSSYTIESDINCMTSNLRNRIGSLVIEEKYGNGQSPSPSNGEAVGIFADENYKGQSAYLLPGSYGTMAQAGFPDNALSSLTLPAGFRVVLYEFENFQGKSYTVSQSKTGFILSGWNDKTSSIAVYRN